MNQTEKLQIFSMKISRATRENVRSVAKALDVTSSEVTRRALNQFVAEEAAKLGIEDGLVKEDQPKPIRQKDLSYRLKTTKDVAI
jgi:predicted transcriptional regulator